MNRSLELVLAGFAFAIAAGPLAAQGPGGAPPPIVPMSPAAQAAAYSNADKVARGEFLVRVGGCHDCHTPLKMTEHGPEPDMSRMLSGHPEDLVMPPPPAPSGPWISSTSGTLTAWAGPWGVSFTKNLTPDETGLGKWTADQFVMALKSGRHEGRGRPILPPMPWTNYGALAEEDLKSIWAYLQTIPPVKNKVPDPLPPVK
jgi:hypothetical protein